MLVQEPVGWILKTVNISILNETQKTKITFSAPKSYRVFGEMGHSFMISFRTLCCKLVIVQHQHWKKTELRHWSYHFQDLEVSFHTDDHVIFFLGYSTKVSFFLSLFFLFFWGIPIPFIPLEWQACYTPNSITPESNFNLLTPKNDKHLISPERITPKSNIKFRRIRDRKLKQLLIVKQILLVNISGNV